MDKIHKYFEIKYNTKAIIIGLTNNEIFTKLNVIPNKKSRRDLVSMLNKHYSDYQEDAEAFAIKIKNLSYNICLTIINYIIKILKK